MTKLEHFEKSARAMERSRWLGRQSAAICEEGMEQVEKTRDLLKELGQKLQLAGDRNA